MELSQRLSIEYRLLLNQTQIQSLELLSLNNIELQALMEKEYLENPLLEYREGRGKVVREDRINDVPDIPVYDRQETADIIREQLNMKQYTEEEKQVTETLLMCLDNKGYMRDSIYEIANMLGVEAETAEWCLKQLKKLEPAGLFAKNLEECLLIQLDRAGIKDEKLESIIQGHLGDVATGRISNITRSLKISSVEVKKYIEFIKKLNPVPLTGMGTEKAEYIVPDVICRRLENTWQIEINDNWTANYEVSDFYLQMYHQTKDDELKQYFKKKVERIQFVINSIEQRKRTLTNVTEQMLEWQKDFFIEQGELKPMKMEDIAECLDIHVSTVSRCVKNKYLEYPHGIIAMKKLFVAGAGGCETDTTVLQVKQRIKKLIDEEIKSKPLSDQQICDRLKKEQISLSRRGVAKYRMQMGIPTSCERRER